MTQSVVAVTTRDADDAENSFELVRLGSGITVMRSRRRLTRKGLANRLRVTAKRLGHWERGACQPPLSKLLALGRVFDMSVEELVAAGDLNESTRLRSHEGPETLERRSRMSEETSEETGNIDVEITLPGVEGSGQGQSPGQPPVEPIDPDLKSERVQVDASEPAPAQE